MRIYESSSNKRYSAAPPGAGAVFLLPYYMGLYHGLIKGEGIGKLNQPTL